MINGYVERALFVIGDPDHGKSTQLRSMLRDWRFGYRGQILTGKIRETYSLSNERWLYLRLTSPHEFGETLQEFLEKCEKKMRRSKNLARRWNFAGALQISPSVNLRKTGPEVVEAFIRRFDPERIRAIVLLPTQAGNFSKNEDHLEVINALSELPNTEVVTMNALERSKNGLSYADFFDFT